LKLGGGETTEFGRDVTQPSCRSVNETLGVIQQRWERGLPKAAGPLAPES
jgi:hypothetical protein